MGQMVARVLVLTGGVGGLAIVALAAALVYLTSVIARVAVVPTARRFETNVDSPESLADSEGLSALGACDAGGLSPGPGESNDPRPQLGMRFQLSQRELEVLRLLVEGRSAKYVSEELVISFNTARSHIRHIHEKLDVHSKQELISLIRKKGE